MWQDFPWLVVVVADLGAEPHEYDLRMGYHHFGMSSGISEVQVSPLTIFFMINYLVGGIPTPL
jgi:hypothetical protein